MNLFKRLSKSIIASPLAGIFFFGAPAAALAKEPTVLILPSPLHGDLHFLTVANMLTCLADRARKVAQRDEIDSQKDIQPIHLDPVEGMGDHISCDYQFQVLGFMGNFVFSDPVKYLDCGFRIKGSKIDLPTLNEAVFQDTVVEYQAAFSGSTKIKERNRYFFPEGTVTNGRNPDKVNEGERFEDTDIRIHIAAPESQDIERLKRALRPLPGLCNAKWAPT